MKIMGGCSVGDGGAGGGGGVGEEGRDVGLGGKGELDGLLWVGRAWRFVHLSVGTIQ